MTSKSDTDNVGALIAPDQDFQKMIDDNAEKAWQEYCKEHGIDPYEVNDELLWDSDCPF